MRKILLIDCDAFFVQVARLEDPELAGRAEYLIVGGSPKSRGVVSSASYEARRHGVRSAMPTAQALRLCPDALVVPVPREACQRRSREVREVLDRFTPLVDPASIDEFYLDLSGTEALYGDETLEELAERIRAAVLAETGIEVSVGGGRYRTIAKLAVERAKPAGVRVVAEGEEPEFMSGIELRELPGVGPVMAERLRGLGMRMVPDALRYDESQLRGMLGESAGTLLYQRVRGLDPVGSSRRPSSRSISREETFARDIMDDTELRTELLRLVVRVSADLRGEGLRARTVTVKLRDSDFRTRQAGRTFDDALAADRSIYLVAVELLDKLRADRRTGARLVGVTLSQLVGPGPGDSAVEQLGLFGGMESAPQAESLESERDRTISRAVDALRRRYGPNAVVPGRIIED